MSEKDIQCNENNGNESPVRLNLVTARGRASVFFNQVFFYQRKFAVCVDDERRWTWREGSAVAEAVRGPARRSSGPWWAAKRRRRASRRRSTRAKISANSTASTAKRLKFWNGVVAPDAASSAAYPPTRSVRPSGWHLHLISLAQITFIMSKPQKNLQLLRKTMASLNFLMYSSIIFIAVSFFACLVSSPWLKKPWSHGNGSQMSFLDLNSLLKFIAVSCFLFFHFYRIPWSQVTLTIAKTLISHFPFFHHNNW